MPTKRSLAAKKAARTRKLRAAGKKAAKTRKRRAAGRKAVGTRKRRAAARKAVTTKKLRAAAAQAPPAPAEVQAAPAEVPPAAPEVRLIRERVKLGILPAGRYSFRSAARALSDLAAGLSGCSGIDAVHEKSVPVSTHPRIRRLTSCRELSRQSKAHLV